MRKMGMKIKEKMLIKKICSIMFIWLSFGCVVSFSVRAAEVGHKDGGISPLRSETDYEGIGRNAGIDFISEMSAKYVVSWRNTYIKVTMGNNYSSSLEYECEISTDGVHYEKNGIKKGKEFSVTIDTPTEKMKIYYIRVRPIYMSGNRGEYSKPLEVKICRPSYIRFAPDLDRKTEIAVGSVIPLAVDIGDAEYYKENQVEIPLKWGFIYRSASLLRTDITADEKETPEVDVGGCSISNGILRIANDNSLIGRKVLLYCRMTCDRHPSNNLPFAYKEFEIGPAVTKLKIDSDDSEISMVKGKNKKLHLIVYPSNAVDISPTWTSSNSAVVTVNQEGYIQAVGYGNAMVTVTSANGKTAKVKVTVHKPSIDKKLNLLLGEGDYIDVENAAKLPTFKIENPKILQIKKIYKKDHSLRLIGLKPGKTRLIVNADGNELICKVTVKKPVFKLKKMQLKVGQSKKNKIKNEYIILFKIKWKSANKNIADVSPKGTVTAKKKGKTKITATINKCKISYWVIIK